MADKPVPIVEKRLRDVKLGELGTWLGGRSFTPYGIFKAICRARQQYFEKYFFVKKAGLGGVSIALASYVVISYIWQFEHLKHERWRKYH